jgi:hypothetical protein
MGREKTQINKIRNEKWKITNTKQILKIIRVYIKNLHSNKLENTEEKEKFLDA